MAANETSTFRDTNSAGQNGSASALARGDQGNATSTSTAGLRRGMSVANSSSSSASHSLTNTQDPRLVNTTARDSASLPLSQSTKLELRKRHVTRDGIPQSDGPQPSPLQDRAKMEVPQTKKRPSWLFLALASGAFAALNGAFAKLYVDSPT